MEALETIYILMTVICAYWLSDQEEFSGTWKKDLVSSIACPLWPIAFIIAFVKGCK